MVCATCAIQFRKTRLLAAVFAMRSQPHAIHKIIRCLTYIITRNVVAKPGKEVKSVMSEKTSKRKTEINYVRAHAQVNFGPLA